MDLDALHAWGQFPVAAVEATVAVAMLVRWRWATLGRQELDSTLTLLLSVFIATIAVKQSFWSIWGAFQAADLFVHASAVKSHVWPIINNVCITLAGLAVIARACVPTIGVGSYAMAAVIGVILYAIAWIR